MAVVLDPEKIIWFEHFRGARDHNFLSGEKLHLGVADSLYIVAATPPENTYSVSKRARGEKEIIEGISSREANLVTAMDLCEQHYQKEISTKVSGHYR